ncbi:MAG: hypothetical protein NTZ61_18580, partial [Proteobacteria bacterium]|nr:hypothetical protein [Pseudomonadota bacterium]
MTIPRSIRLPLSTLATAAFLLVAMRPARAQQAVDPPPTETRDLRQRLTEREDENRVEQPIQFNVFGRPLSWSSHYETTVDYLDPAVLGAGERKHDQL